MSIEQVKEFHEVFGHPVANELMIPDMDTVKLRKTLILEELDETLRDFFAGNFVKMVDGLADLRVVIYGTILVYGGYEAVSKIIRTNYDVEEVPEMPVRSEMLELGTEIQHHVNKMGTASIRNNALSAVHHCLTMLDVIEDVTYMNDIPILEIDDAVHKANMSKLGEDGKPIYRESDNKILKGPNFRPPEEDIEAILKANGAEL